jgi:hypothetical protein
MEIDFTPPLEPAAPTVHHARAAARNAAVADEASGELRDALSGPAEIDRILLKAAAGAGKSYVLKRLVADAVQHPRCLRVGVIAFQNRQLWPIATSLGKTLGKGASVCSPARTGTTTYPPMSTSTPKSQPPRPPSHTTASSSSRRPTS